jgi:RNA polymerase sigma-70 factor (ECF subfamily)
VEVEPPPLPRRARRRAEQVVFFDRVEAGAAETEDARSNRLVAEVQAGRCEAFADLYSRHFDRVFGYLRIALGDHHAAEDTTQQVFIRALEKIGDYEIRAELPFRAWLLGIARYEALNYIRKRSRVDVITPEEIDRRIEADVSAFDRSVLEALSDPDLTRFLTRLPQLQLQVLTLHYVLGYKLVEIGKLMGRSAQSVRQLHHRALVWLEHHMTADGDVPVRTRASRAPVRVLVRQSIALRTRRFVLTRSLGAPSLAGRSLAYIRGGRW